MKIHVAVLILIISATTYCADKYAHASGDWASTSIWYTTASGGSLTTKPVAGDNAFTNGFVVTVSATNEYCTNLTITDLKNAITINSSCNLNISGLLDAAAILTLDAIGGTGTIILTGGSPSGTTVLGANFTNKAVYNNLTIDPGAGNIAWFSSNIKFDAAFTVNSGTFQITGSTQRDIFCSTANAGTVTIATGAILDSYGASTLGGSIYGGALGSNILNTTINGTLILGNSLNGGAITIGTSGDYKNYTRNGNFYNTTPPTSFTCNGKMEYVRSITQTVYGATYNNLTLGGSSAKTLGGNATVNGTLSLEGTASFALGGFILSYGASAVLQYAGSSAQSSGDELSATMPNLTLNNTAGAVTINTPVTVTSTTIVNTNNTMVLGASLNNNATASYTQLHGTVQLNSGGSISNAVTWYTGSTLIYNEGGSVTTSANEWPSSGPTNITILNNTAVTMLASNPRTISGTLTITSGSLADNGNVLTVNGNIVNNGTCSSSTGGRIYLSGGSAVHTLSGTNGSYANLELNDSQGANINTAVSINGVLALTTGTLAINAQLTNSGTASIGNGTKVQFNSGGSLLGNALTYNTGSTAEYNTTTVCTLGVSIAYYNLTINSGAKLFAKPTTSANAVVTINGDLFIDGGTLQLSGTTLAPNYYGTIKSYGNVTVQAYGSIIMSTGSSDVTGAAGKQFTLRGGGTLTCTIPGVDPLSSFLTPDTWLIKNDTMTTLIIKLSNDATLKNPPNSQQIGNLMFSPASGTGNNKLTLGENISIAGDFSIKDSSSATGTLTYDFAGYSINTTGSGKTVSLLQYFTSTQILLQGSAPNLFSNFSSYSFLPSPSVNCIVNYNGAGQNIISAPYDELRVTSAGTNSLSGAANADTLRISSGTLQDAGHILTVTGALSNSGIHTGSGKITMAGSSQQTMSGTGTYGNIELNNSTGASLTASIAVAGTLTITLGDLTTNANTVTLGGSASLSETAGNMVLGNITTTRTANQGSNNTFGGIGVEINAAGAAPGSTTVFRVTGSAKSGNGYVSIKRYYNITPTTDSNLLAKLIFHYDNRTSELNNLTEDSLEVFKSTDSGNSWTLGAGTLNKTTRTITLDSINSFSMWTAGATDNPLPVELSDFSSAVYGREVRLNWSTATELNSHKFVIERSTVGANQWMSLGEVLANNYSNAPKYYNFTDKNTNCGTYAYRLKMIDNDGTFEYSKITTEAIIAAPTKFSLSQNYPNPFNPTTKITYMLPTECHVLLELYSISGKRVATLLNDNRASGYYDLTVDASNFGLASGIYIYRFIGQDLHSDKQFSSMKKMIFLK